jgi:hypothetical protein
MRARAGGAKHYTLVLIVVAPLKNHKKQASGSLGGGVFLFLSLIKFALPIDFSSIIV